jgi:hypothetical protein
LIQSAFYIEYLLFYNSVFIPSQSPCCCFLCVCFCWPVFTSLDPVSFYWFFFLLQVLYPSHRIASPPPSHRLFFC